jgi:hypothetical protein
MVRSSSSVPGNSSAIAFASGTRPRLTAPRVAPTHESAANTALTYHHGKLHGSGTHDEVATLLEGGLVPRQATFARLMVLARRMTLRSLGR